MGRYAYEIHRVGSAEGYMVADSPEQAREKILDEMYDFDWDYDTPDLDVFDYDHDS